MTTNTDTEPDHDTLTTDESPARPRQRRRIILATAITATVLAAAGGTTAAVTIHQQQQRAAELAAAANEHAAVTALCADTLAKAKATQTKITTAVNEADAALAAVNTTKLPGDAGESRPYVNARTAQPADPGNNIPGHDSGQQLIAAVTTAKTAVQDLTLGSTCTSRDDAATITNTITNTANPVKELTTATNTLTNDYNAFQAEETKRIADEKAAAEQAPAAQAAAEQAARDAATAQTNTNRNNNGTGSSSGGSSGSSGSSGGTTSNSDTANSGGGNTAPEPAAPAPQDRYTDANGNTHIQVNDHVGIILPPAPPTSDIDCDKIGRHGICNPDFEPFG